MPHTPTITRDMYSPYAVFEIELDRCAICERAMVPLAATRANVWPVFYSDTLEAQAKRGGFPIASNLTRDGDAICRACAQEGRAGFTCAHCEQFRTTDQAVRVFGIDDQDVLCQTCYETVPAKQWDGVVQTLHDRHRYDHE